MVSLGVGLALDEYWTWKDISWKRHWLEAGTMYLRQKYTPGSEATHCAAILVLLAMSNLVGTVVYARVF